MLEQLKIQKQQVSKPQPFQFQPSASPTSSSNNPTSSSNKLQQYFQNNSYILQQQQLSIFIKDFPIIKLSQIKNINILINTLIKQNQLLGTKCQQQINLLKQEYLKHDKLIKSNKEVKIDKEKLEKQNRSLNEEMSLLKSQGRFDTIRKEQCQIIQRKYQAQLLKNNITLKQLNQKLTKQTQILLLISTEQYKKCQQTLKTTSSIFDSKILTNLQQYLTKQRKKSKRLSKVKQIVEEFCIRLEKITKVVSTSLLASQLSIQANNMLELIGDILVDGRERQRQMSKSKYKNKGQIGSQKNLSVSSSSQYVNTSIHKTSHHKSKNPDFFQKMLTKIAQQSQSSTTTKQQISNQLQNLRQNLQHSKSIYENTLKTIKQQFKQKQQQFSKKIHLKQQTILYYEQQHEKNRANIANLQEQLQVINNNMNNLRRELQSKNITVQALENKIGQINKQYKENTQDKRSEFQYRIQELKRISAIKIQQREELLNQLNERRKKQQSQYQQKIQQLKEKMENIYGQCIQKQNNIKNYLNKLQYLETQLQKSANKNHEIQTQLKNNRQQQNQIQQKLSKKNKQVDEFKQTLNTLQHEKKLQSAYITELQSKIQTLNNKIKTLESKTKNQQTNKKELTNMKNTIVEQKQKNEQYQQYCSQIKQENQRLKSIVKQMKKQLEDVYVRLGELKQIQQERQRLIVEVEKSQRRRQDVFKQYEQMKFQMLKLESQNKKMHLELKHFRNVFNRIKFVEDD